MAFLNSNDAAKAAIEIVKAAAQANSLKLNGAPAVGGSTEEWAKSDGLYIATLINTIAAAIEDK